MAAVWRHVPINEYWRAQARLAGVA